jgi:hypothetical protein
MNGHRSAVDLVKLEQPFAHHFKTHHHEWPDVEVSILEDVGEGGNLDQAESFWISQFMSDHPFGLNIQNILYRNCFRMSDLH